MKIRTFRASWNSAWTKQRRILCTSKRERALVLPHLGVHFMHAERTPFKSLARLPGRDDVEYQGRSAFPAVTRIPHSYYGRRRRASWLGVALLLPLHGEPLSPAVASPGARVEISARAQGHGRPLTTTTPALRAREGGDDDTPTATMLEENELEGKKRARKRNDG